MLRKRFLTKGQSSGLVALMATGSLLALLHGCGGEEESAQNLETFDGLYNVYLKTCAGPCHAPGRNGEKFVKGFDFSTADTAYRSLQAAVDIDRTELCKVVQYVKAGDPEQSLLVAVLDPSVNAGFGSRTGSNCDPKNHTIANGGEADNPSAAVLDGLKKWISAGAVR